jgi:Fe-S cluster assembly iron-binding protein IscA
MKKFLLLIIVSLLVGAGKMSGQCTIGGSKDQTVCINTAISSITFTIAGATGGSITAGALPGGVTANFTAPTLTISGTPTESGTFNYTVSLTGPTPCSSPGTITVNALPTVDLTSSDADNVICAGDAVTFTATGGPDYEFFVDGSSTGAASAINTFTTSSLTNGQKVKVTITKGGCTVTSGEITTTVNALPTADLTSDDADNIVCAGDAVTFTATGGTEYEFFVDGSSQGVASATADFTTSTLTNGQEVTVEVTNASGCKVTPAGITIEVPTAGLSSSDADNIICAGDAVTFTATGGPDYEFFVDGSTTGAASATNTFTTSSLTNGQKVKVTITKGGCTATSGEITTTVNALPTADLTSDDADNIVCAGDAVTFTATGGTEYEFFVDGSSQGAASATADFTTSTLTNGQEVTVEVTNASGCKVTPAGITIEVPTAGLSSSDADNIICAGDAVTFTATGGPDYEFFVDGSTTGAASATNTFTTSSLTNGQKVKVTITKGGCTATSGEITTTVNALPTPVITGAATACDGTTGSVYSVIDVAGHTYAWTVVGGTFTPTTTHEITVTWNVAGAGTVDVTETITATGCSKAATQKDVTVTALPTPVISGAAAACDGTTGSVYSVVDVADHTYAWTVVGGTITAGTDTHEITVTWNVAGAGTVNVTETITATGCSKAATQKDVTVIALPTPVISGAAAACDGTTGSVYSVADVADHTYAWTVVGGTITAGTDTHEITVTWNVVGAGTVNVTETITATGCSKAATQKDVTVTALPTPVISGATAACYGTTGSVYSVPDVADHTYAWTVVGGTFTPTTTHEIAVTWNVTGAGTVNVTETITASGCSKAATQKDVTVNALPVAGDITGGSNEVCMGFTLALTSHASGTGPFTYTWASTDEAIATVSNVGVVTPVSPGTIGITYTVTDGTTTGCQATSNSYSVTVNALSAGGTITPANQSTCNGSLPTTNLELSGKIGNLLRWEKATDSGFSTPTTISGATSTTLSAASIGALSVDTYIRAVVKNSTCDEVYSTTALIVVNPLPTLGSVSQASAVCSGSAATINLTGLLAGSAYKVDYTINGTLQPQATTGIANGSGAASFTAVLLAASNGKTLQTTTITNSTTGCSASISKNTILIVNTASVPTLSGVSAPCINTIETYTTESGMGSSYIWSFSGGGVPSGGGVSDNTITVTWNTASPPDHTISVKYTDGNGCTVSSPTVKSITVNPLPVPTITGPTSARETSTGNIYTTQPGMLSYTWTVTGGSITSGGNGSNLAMITWNTPGSQTVSVTCVNANNCTGSSNNYDVTVNPLPVASLVHIDGTVSVGSLLTGDYTYTDGAGFDDACTFRWLRNGIAIPGATQKTYTVDLDDEGTSLTFEVTPVSTSGYPNTGTTVVSAPVGPVPSSGLVPQALGVCIQGKRALNEVLTGKYFYDFPKAQGATSLAWYRGTNPTPIGTGSTYTLTLDDINEDIKFEVLPRSVSPVKEGSLVTSASLARINLTEDRYTNQVDTVILTAIPTGGAFSGPGVTNGIFSPSMVGISDDPYEVKYNLNIVNNYTTCVQEDIIDIYVEESETRFDGVKNPICHDDGNLTFHIKDVPPGAIPYYGYGFFFNWQPYIYRYPDDTYYYFYAYGQTDPRIVSQNFSGGVAYVDDVNTPWTVTIKPSELTVGNGYDVIFLYYYLNGSYYLLQQSLNVLEVAHLEEISNLKDSYCLKDDPTEIQVYGLYPSLGTATWTGSLLTSTSGLTTNIDPEKAIGDILTLPKTYPITYQYEVQGCKSNLITKNVTINPMPNVLFSIDPLFNLNGEAVPLEPETVPETGWDYSFVGPGVIKDVDNPNVYKFLPGIAETGPKTIGYKVTTDKGCYDYETHDIDVEKADGNFNGIPDRDPDNLIQICYSDETFNISVSDIPNTVNPWVPVAFWNAKNSLVWTPGTLNAQYSVAAAGAGYDTLFFKYRKLDVYFTIKKPVYIDLVGKITITGLKDEYCDYEDVATVRALVENPTGSGTFTFTGPPEAFTNYVGYATLDPTKVTPGTTFNVNYNFISTVNSSNCPKTETLPVLINQSPSVNIINNRTTINIKETPIVLSGTPTEGIFSGRGVYKSGSNYVFDPFVASLGDAEFSLSYTNSKGCTATKKDTLTVAAASGSILGINTNNQYCYDGLKDTITYTSPKPWNNGSFSGAGITNVASAKAVFDPAAAGKGDHDIIFTYYDQYNTKFEVSSSVNVDSLGIVEIKPIAAGEEYCENAAPVELITTPRGGTFTGPVTTGYFTPSKALGDTAITYTYLNVRTGCSITGRVPFTIHPAPVVSFVPSDICIENELDSIRFLNNTNSADAIGKWLWSFSDIGGTDFSGKQAPAYLFKSGGQHLITLTATTVNNCAAKKDLTYDLGVKPKADFFWKNECYVPGDSIMLLDNTVSTSEVKSRTWNFFDGKPLKSGTTVYYPKTAVGAIPVQYIVQTNYANCSDTVNKSIFVRPNIVLSSDGYFENFESGNGGWSKGDESLNSWTFGTPDRKTIKSAASGSTAWYTRFDTVRVESSSVISPCFDFKNIDRPMISIGLWRNFDEDRDGAALQYRIGDAGTWQYVGTLNDGINWYNSVLIKGKPGGDQLGWTTSVADPKWIESRHTLDDLKGKKDVKFRIAYGSDGNAKKGTEGLAFDDIFIGERKRNVLMEHFANTSSLTSSEATAMINQVDAAIDKDVVNIQYHTNFPGVDSFYVSNPGDASARILFYGLTKAPYTFIDGGTKKLYANVFDYSSRELDGSLTDINSNDVVRRGLINPLFEIKLDSLVVNGGVLTVGGDIVALADTNVSNLTLYLAVVEKTNSKYEGAAGETTFRNVFRKFVPDAAGINLGKTWTKGTSVPIQDQTWIIQKTLNSSDIEVVAFLQNNITKDVYQAASMLKPKITVGIEKPGVLNNIDFALYPNPAKHQLTIRFGEPLKDVTEIFIYDFSGTMVKSYKTGSGETEYSIDDLGLKDGMYLIRVSSGGISMGFKKLIVSGS